jgi:hypothetical protein
MRLNFTEINETIEINISTSATAAAVGEKGQLSTNLGRHNRERRYFLKFKY